MRTTRERTNRGLPRERGIVGLVLLALIVVVIALGAFFFVVRKQDEKTTNTDSTSTTTTDIAADSKYNEETPLQRNQVNTQRRNDASVLLSATNEYIMNNSGSMPREMHDSMLVGLDYYDTATLADGTQSAVATDELRLVLGAECVEDGATVAASSSRVFAVQFGVRKASTGAFEGDCVNN
jgi:hypothetical protein